MARRSPALCFVLLAALTGTLASCTKDGATDTPSPPADAVRQPDERDPADPPPEDAPDPTTVFDAADAIFDTLEPPPSPGIEIREPTQPRPRPQPLPLPDPTPLPAPPPLPPPTPAPPVAGSCDVRGTESYCFTYTGAAWNASSAEAHCGSAPDARYRLAECPAEGRIATCVFRRGETPSREIVYTYYEPYDLGLARLACPGRFTEE